MAAGCVVMASDDAPVREVLTQGQTGLLVQPDDDDSWLRQARAVLDDPAAYRPLGQAAASLVRERYSQETTLPKLTTLFDRLVEMRS
jgi:glycosyltransferase involved in cell wall biosynthesis